MKGIKFNTKIIFLITIRVTIPASTGWVELANFFLKVKFSRTKNITKIPKTNNIIYQKPAKSGEFISIERSSIKINAAEIRKKTRLVMGMVLFQSDLGGCGTLVGNGIAMLLTFVF